MLALLNTVRAHDVIVRQKLITHYVRSARRADSALGAYFQVRILNYLLHCAFVTEMLEESYRSESAEECDHTGEQICHGSAFLHRQ